MPYKLKNKEAGILKYFGDTGNSQLNSTWKYIFLNFRVHGNKIFYSYIFCKYIIFNINIYLIYIYNSIFNIKKYQKQKKENVIIYVNKNRIYVADIKGEKIHWRHEIHRGQEGTVIWFTDMKCELKVMCR